MAKWYDFVIAVWLRLETASDASALRDELWEYLELEYQILKLETVEDLTDHREGELTVSLQLQLTFEESEMDSEEPTDEALGKLDRDLRRA